MTAVSVTPPQLGTGDFAVGGPVWPGLAELIARAGGAAQAATRIVAEHGRTAHWDGSDLRLQLQEALADLHAALVFTVAHNELDDCEVEARCLDRLRHLELLRAENALIQDPPAGHTALRSQALARRNPRGDRWMVEITPAADGRRLLPAPEDAHGPDRLQGDGGAITWLDNIDAALAGQGVTRLTSWVPLRSGERPSARGAGDAPYSCDVVAYRAA